MHYKGSLFIVSAPSGCGKTTILKSLTKKVDNLKFSISTTTRDPRAGEVPGQDYYFVTKEEFLRSLQEGQFLEWARVHGNYYGTSRLMLDRWIREGYDVILDIDFQGARQIKAQYGSAVTIFIIPPSWKELEKRLKERATDPETVIRQRLETARLEIKEAFWYDYLIVNDKVDAAVEEITHIIKSFRCKVSARFNSLIRLAQSADDN